VDGEDDRQPLVDARSAKACPSCSTRYPADALFCAFDGSPLATSPAAIAAAAATDTYIGREIVGSIEIRQLVGIGAMGRVYRGFQKGIDRDVAVKILHRELSANPTLVARFHREARVASRLAHSNVVHVHLTGQLPDGAMYIVMEYLDGMSLQGALAASGGAMPLPRALHVALQLCDAVGEAHAQGIVHRDLKPENVMLVRRTDDPDFVKVLDFGIARLNWGEPSSSSAAGLIFGTARYISPEGARGETVGPSGDVYSIATMLYQMLSGRTPFEAEQAVALLVKQIHDAPGPLGAMPRAAYVPRAIATAVMKNLAKAPEARAANGRELGRVLIEAAGSSGLGAHDPLARPGRTAGRTTDAGREGADPDDRLRIAPTVFDDLAPAAPHGSDYGPASEGARHVSRTEVPGRETVRAPSSSVDETMDERQQPVSNGGPMGPAMPITPSGRSTLESGAPFRTPPPSSGTRASPDVPPRSTRHGRVYAFVVVCFLVGVVGTATFASKTGLFGPHREQPEEIDTVVAHANDALLHQRWDAPRGDNVRDITGEGLVRWPNEPRLSRIRALACGDIVKTARAKRDEGSGAEALRLARLANLLDPGDEPAQKLTAELESLSLAPPVDSVPPLAAVPERVRPLSATAAPRLTLEASNPKPAAGEPVEFSVRVAPAASSGHTNIESASFRVSGPGVSPGTRLDSVADGSGQFKAIYAFAQPGRFEVAFGARAEGAPVRAVRVFQVSAPTVPKSPVPAPPAPAAAPSASSSAKWL
jgi:eukaryotic-like serine/threonine-protein kinase